MVFIRVGPCPTLSKIKGLSPVHRIHSRSQSTQRAFAGGVELNSLRMGNRQAATPTLRLGHPESQLRTYGNSHSMRFEMLLEWTFSTGGLEGVRVVVRAF